MPHLVADRVGPSVNGRMAQRWSINITVTTANINGDTLQAPRLWFYPKAGKHLLKKFTHDEAIAEADGAGMRFTQHANMTALQYCKALCIKAIRVGDV